LQEIEKNAKINATNTAKSLFFIIKQSLF